MRALIAYATWYGATADTSERIADVLRRRGIDVDLVDLDETLIDDVSDYELIIVGTGIRMGRWKGDADKFIDRHRHELSDKNFVMFASAGGAAIDRKKGEEEKWNEAYEKHLVERAEKYSLNPVSMTLFGGIFDYDQMNWLTRRLMGRVKNDLKEAGFQEREDKFDTRDKERIDRWAEDLADKLDV